MKTKLFKDQDGKFLRVDSRKSAIYFYYGEDKVISEEAKEEMKKNKSHQIFSSSFQIRYNFSKEQLVELFTYLTSEANQSWKNINPKQATSLASDYFSYYDRELDNNGYLSLGINITSEIVSPYGSDSSRLFKFTKSKMESFLYDLDNRIQNG